MKPGAKYVKYAKECPFCKSTVVGVLGINLICDCNAKYYFFDKLWLNRNTGEKVFEKVAVESDDV